MSIENDASPTTKSKQQKEEERLARNRVLIVCLFLFFFSCVAAGIALEMTKDRSLNDPNGNASGIEAGTNGETDSDITP